MSVSLVKGVNEKGRRRWRRERERRVSVILYFKLSHYIKIGQVKMWAGSSKCISFVFRINNYSSVQICCWPIHSTNICWGNTGIFAVQNEKH